MDKIIICDLPVQAILGTLPAERTGKQKLVLHAELFADLKKAGRSDDLKETFDYSQVEATLIRETERSSFFLLEALAEHLCRIILTEQPEIEMIRLRIDKPGATKTARCISIEIERKRTDL